MPDRDLVYAVPTLEARHSINVPGVGLLYLHDPQGVLPRGRCSQIDGLQSLADMTDRRDQRVMGRGEIPRRAVRGGKTVTYTGTLQASSLEQLRVFQGRLRQHLEQSDEIEVVLTPHASYTALQSWKFKGRCITFDPDESQTFAPTAMPSPWQRSFVCSFRLSDARIYQGAEVTLLTPLGTGAAAVTANLTNIGTAPADPILRVTGPVVGGRVRRGGNGGPAISLLTAANIAGGTYWDIDFAKRAITNAAGVKQRYDIANSSWWDQDIEGFPIGAHLFELYQAAGFPGINSRLSVIYTPAAW